MSQRHPQPAPGGRPVSRRRLLNTALLWASTLSTLAVLPEMTGCTPSEPLVDAASPSVSGRPRSTASPGSPASTTAPGPAGTHPTPTDATDPRVTATSEQALAALAAAILAGPHRGELTGALRRRLTAVREGHRQHVMTLLTTTAGGQPSATPPAGFAQLPLGKSVQLLAAREQQQAGRLRRAAAAGEGHDALLRGSMMVAASGYAAVLRGRGEVAVVGSPPPAAAAVSDVVALQSVVRQLHALVYGYQLALGQLSESSPAGRRALAALAARRRLRDRLERILLARSATVPAAAGAYVPLVQPTSARRSGVLIRRMETAFEPFCGLWLASAARTEDRRLALDTLAHATAAALSWGAAVRPWPGWPA